MTTSNFKQRYSNISWNNTNERFLFGHERNNVTRSTRWNFKNKSHIEIMTATKDLAVCVYAALIITAVVVSLITLL
jgi:hypothetical protein